MLKKKQYYNPESALHTSLSMTEKNREDKIDELEKRRLDVVRQIESLLRDFSKETGERRLRERGKKVGKAPNDYRKSKR